MPNYLLAYRGGSMPETPAAQEAVMTQWTKWFQELGDAVVDGGNPISVSKMVASSGAVADVGATDALAGYSVIKADSLESAVKMAQGCPVRQAGGNIQVCETFDAM